MGIGYLYYNADDREFLDPEALHPTVNGKWPVGLVAANVLHYLLRNPWNGKRVNCITDTVDYPWQDLNSEDYNAVKPGWRNVIEAHRDLVQVAIDQALDELADEKAGNTYPATMSEAILRLEYAASLIGLSEMLETRLQAVPPGDDVLSPAAMLNALYCGYIVHECEHNWFVKLEYGQVRLESLQPPGQVALFDNAYRWRLVR